MIIKRMFTLFLFFTINIVDWWKPEPNETESNTNSPPLKLSTDWIQTLKKLMNAQ